MTLAELREQIIENMMSGSIRRDDELILFGSVTDMRELQSEIKVKLSFDAPGINAPKENFTLALAGVKVHCLPTFENSEVLTKVLWKKS